MKPWLIVLIVVLGVIILLAIFLSIAVARYFAYPIRYTYEQANDFLKEHNVYGNYDSYAKKDYEIKLRDSYVVNARYIENKEKTNKFILLVHGLTVNQMYSSKYVDLFYDLGFNIVTYDQRAHLNNKKCISTMGIKEGRDLIEVIDDMKKRYGDNIEIGVHGESLGSATIIESFIYQPQFKFVILDCPYADLMLVAKGEAKKFHAPPFLLNISGAIGSFLYGYNFTKVKPKNFINCIKSPILFCHGEEDKLIPVEHSKSMFEAYKGPKKIHLTKNADHAQSFEFDKEGYVKVVRDFVNKYSKKES